MAERFHQEDCPYTANLAGRAEQWVWGEDLWIGAQRYLTCIMVEIGWVSGVRAKVILVLMWPLWWLPRRRAIGALVG